MKKLTKTLILALIATTAVQAMDNRPRPNWKNKIKEKVKQLPGITFIVNKVEKEFEKAQAQIETIERFYEQFLAAMKEVHDRQNFLPITPKRKTSKTEKCPVCYETKPIIELKCHPQHFICPDCFKDAITNNFTKCFFCQKNF